MCNPLITRSKKCHLLFNVLQESGCDLVRMTFKVGEDLSTYHFVCFAALNTQPWRGAEPLKNLNEVWAAFTLGSQLTWLELVFYRHIFFSVSACRLFSPQNWQGFKTPSKVLVWRLLSRGTDLREQTSNPNTTCAVRSCPNSWRWTYDEVGWDRIILYMVLI